MITCISNIIRVGDAMGADMIGYIMVGPDKISDESIQRAAEKIMKIKDILQVCQNCNDPLDEDCVCDGCGSISENYLNIKTIEDAIFRVKDIIENWPPGYRDCCVRGDPLRSDYSIVFAGEMSWGDSPGGRGFLTLERIYMSGLMDELAIF